MVQFSERMVSEVVQVFWAAIARGEFITDAAAGRYLSGERRPLAARGGRGPPAPWSGSEGSLSDVWGAGGDRAGACWR